ncbi:MAG: M28 family metallopeptidase [Candidatus Thorarchaeota archaeon]
MTSRLKFAGSRAFGVCRYLAQTIGERVQGLESTITTKEYLCNQLIEHGLEKVHAQAFPVLTSRQKKAYIHFGNRTFEGLSFGLSGTTGSEGITGPIAKYTSWSWNPSADELASFSNKIVVLYTRDFSQEVVHKLIQARVRGIIHVTYEPGIPVKLPMGFIYSGLKTGDFDLLPPIVSINYRDGAKLLSNSRDVTIQTDVTILQSESFNILGEIPGRESDAIVLSAHYDSVPYSPGATDNAGGTAILMELARIFAETTPRWTLRFVACGSEECALQGSRYYCRSQPDGLQENKLNLNFDVHGARIGHLAVGVLGGKRLRARVGQAITPWNPKIQPGPTGGDNRIFAYYGIPAVHWWFGGGANFLLNHTSHDRLDMVAPQSLEFAGQAAETFIRELDNRRRLQFSIPKSLQKKNVESIESITTEPDYV